MAELTGQELQAWYADFAQTLKEQVHIDVNCKEDLARIIDFKIIKWDPEDVEPTIDSHYPFMEGEGSKYTNPQPESLQERMKWIIDNQDPNVTEEKIRQLHQMVENGTLLVRDYTGSMQDIRQVRMNGDGKVTVSHPYNKYVAHDSPLDVPEDMRMGPDFPSARYAEPMEMPQKPELPPEPENKNPGLFSRIGAFFGMDTDYAKLERYNEALAAMPRMLQDYEKRMKEYEKNQADVAKWEQYKENFIRAKQGDKNYVFNQLVTTYNLNFQMSNEMDESELLAESNLLNYINRKHYDTPDGACHRFIDENKRRVDVHGAKALKGLMGTQHERVTEWLEKNVYDPREYYPKPYQIPNEIQNPNTSREVLKGLAPLACFAALADPQVTGADPIEGLTPEQTAKIRYGETLNNLFTYGRAGSDGSIKYLTPAREMGINALNAYAAGDPGQLGKLLGQCLRQTTREAAGLFGPSEHATNTFYFCDRLLEALEKDPQLMAAAELTPEELQEAQANAQYRNVMRNGHAAKVSLMEHAMGIKTMNEEARRQAVTDVLFMTVVDNAVAGEKLQWDAQQEKDPEFQAMQVMAQATSSYGELQAQAQEARAKNRPNANSLEEQYRAMRQQNAMITGKQTLHDLERPGSAMRNQLLDPDWVARSRQILSQNPNIDKILACDPRGLKDMLRSNETVTAAVGSDLLPKSKESVNSSEIQRGIESQKQNQNKQGGTKVMGAL